MQEFEREVPSSNTTLELALSIPLGSRGRMLSSISVRLRASVTLMPGSSMLAPGVQYQPKGTPPSLQVSGKSLESSTRSRSMVRLVTL